MSLDRLAALDAATFGTPLPPAHARAAWAEAIAAARRVPLAPLPGTPPRAVTIVASANVFTAPVEWAWALSARGVRVIVKSARGLAAVGQALAGALPGVEARDWRGGDLEAEAAALAESDAAIVFGSAATVAAVRARSPVPVLGFGPRFGVAVVPRVDATTAPGLARDHALHDGRGCMSPAGVFADGVDDRALDAALLAADDAWPPGPVDPADAQARRALALLGRAVGRSREVGSWLVAELPAAHFRPRALPRVVLLYPRAGLVEAVAPYRAELGTLTLPDVPEGDVRAHPDWEAALGLAGLPPARVCAVGEAQRPPGDRPLHDGVPVLATLWGSVPPPS